MKITDLLDEKSIKLNATANSKKQALEQIINLINQTGNIENAEEFKKIVLKNFNFFCKNLKNNPSMLLTYACKSDIIQESKLIYYVHAHIRGRNRVKKNEQ